MIRERFAALEGEVEAILRRQETDPYIPVDQTATVIAGFAVVDPERKALIIQQIAKRISAYAIAKAALLGEVRSLGVEPLATLPAMAWHNICRISKLHRPKIYSICGGSSVSVDANSFATLIEKMSNRAFNIMAWCFAISSPFIVFFSMLYFWFNTLNPFWFISDPNVDIVNPSDKIIGIGVMSVIVFVLTICFIVAINRPVNKMLYRMVARYYLWISWDKTLHMILAREGHPTTIRLPDPPPEVQDVLLKVKSLNPQVAAVAKAIRFPHLIKDAIDLIPEPLPVDPIVYIEKNGVVVIVAQFGDFPIERDVVKRLKANEILR